MKRLGLLVFLGLSLCFFSCNNVNDGRGQNGTEDPELVLKSLFIHEKDVDVSKLEVTLGKDKTKVVTGNVVAKFDYGKEGKNKKIDVEVANASSLQVGDNIIKLSVKASKGHYKAWEKDVKIIIQNVFDLKLDELIIHDGKANIDTETYTCEFDSKHKNVITNDIKATFKLGDAITRVIPLNVENCPAELEYGKPTTIHLVAPASQDEYNKWEHDVVITRKELSAQIDSVVTEFAVNSDIYEVADVKKEKTFPSDIKKAVVFLATNRMFSKVESNAFKVEYLDNYKKDVKLTLKEDLVYGTPIACTIDVTTKEANQDRDDKPIKLEFSLTLKKGELTITSVAIGNMTVENQDETLNVSSTPAEIQLNFTNKAVIGLSASLEKQDGSNKIQGTVFGSVATFASVALEEGVTEFVARASAENAEPSSFRFKVNYTKLQDNKVNIVQVKLDEKPVLQDADETTDKENNVSIKIYLDKEYEEGAVTINGNATTNPFSANKKLFEGTLNGLVENTKTLITIVASAKDKTSSTFSFNVTYVKGAQRLISKILAAGNDDYDSEGILQFATLSDDGNNTFSTLVNGLKLKELKVEITNLQDKELARLKVELSKENKKVIATFVQEGGVYVAKITGINSPLDKLQDNITTVFTLKLLYDDAPIETYTLNIKGCDA